MPKLVVVSGPLRGNTYDLREGENTVGRVVGSDIVLQSQKVSKKHCVLTVVGQSVSVSDAGSSNGTFVNGVLTKAKKLAPGDRVSIGEYVLELSKPAVKAPRPGGSTGMGKVLPFQQPSGLTNANQGLTGLPAMGNLPPMGATPGAAVPGAGTPSAPAPPRDLVEKVKFYFDKYVVNFLYTLNEKHEWSFLVKGLIGVLVVFAAAVSTFPTVSGTQDILMQEARNRGRALAKLMVDHNSAAILERQESKLDIGFAEREDGIVAAYIVDMDSRIMAPGKKLNQSLTEGQQGRFVQAARKYFHNSERYFSMPYWNSDGTVDPLRPALEGNLMGIAEPIKILDPTKGKNVVVAMAVVFVNLNGITMSGESEMLLFLSAVVFASIMAVAVYTSIHRITTRPITQLNYEVDRALRGEVSTVELKSKMSEMQPLIDVINTALSRVAPAAGGATVTASETPEDFLNPMKFVAERSSIPMMVLGAEKNVVFINSQMEEVTGIRNDSSVGAEISTVSRDEAFTLMMTDLLGRAPLGTADGASDTMEFSGVNYQIEAVGLGTMGGSPKGYVISLKETA